MKHFWDNVIGFLSLLYGLSWLILCAGVVLMCFRPNPSPAMTEAIMLTLILAFYYIAVYVVLRGLGRLCGFGHPAVPIPAEPVVIRRVILEEVVSTETRPRRPAHGEKDVTPAAERQGYAR